MRSCHAQALMRPAMVCDRGRPAQTLIEGQSCNSLCSAHNQGRPDQACVLLGSSTGRRCADAECLIVANGKISGCGRPGQYCSRLRITHAQLFMSSIAPASL